MAKYEKYELNNGKIYQVPGVRGEWGEMAVGQNAQIDFVCYSIALAT